MDPQNPIKMYRVVKNFKKIGERTPRNNLNGEGLIMGGLIVFKRGGEVVYSHCAKDKNDARRLKRFWKRRKKRIWDEAHRCVYGKNIGETLCANSLL